MIIKQLYLWRANSDWVWKTEKFFAIILIGFACSGITAALTYWGLSIFGPWFQGSVQVWFFTWLTAFVQQIYFWTRYSRYVNLVRTNRMNIRTGEISTNSFIKKWWNTRKYAKENLQNAKNREREIALGFAGDIKKVTSGKVL